MGSSGSRIERIQRNMVAVPISEIIRPKDGYIVYKDRWWMTDNAGNVFFHRGVVPQCNSSKVVVESIYSRLGFSGVVFIELAFVKNHSS